MKVAPVRGEALCNTDKKEKLEDRIGMVKMKEEKKKQETKNSDISMKMGG